MVEQKIHRRSTHGQTTVTGRKRDGREKPQEEAGELGSMEVLDAE